MKTIEAAAAKTRRRRIVPLLPVAVAFLSSVAREAGPVCGVYKTTKAVRRILAQNGVPYPKDVLRHTYASMRIAAGAGAGTVANEMGNSEGVLMRHYREVVDAQSAAAFWSLTPPATPRRTPPAAPA